jgi:AraC-like DNA-binding protein
MAEGDFSLYLTHSAEDEEWQLVCTDVGQHRIAPGSPYPPDRDQHPAGFVTVAVGRRINEYQMVYILAGGGSLEVDGRQFRVEAGHLFLLFPDVPHAYRPDPDTGWTECWVGFTGPQVDALLAAGIISPTRPLFRPGYQASLVGAFHSIFQQVKVQAPLYQFRVCAGILGLLAETLSLERLSVQQTRAQEIVEKAKAFIEASIPTVFDLERLGAEVRVSQAQLNEVFKAYTGMTPYQYCIHAKINRAKEILSSGESSVKEIAWQVGFDDQYYFSRLFKKKTGSSPSQWTAVGVDTVDAGN